MRPQHRARRWQVRPWLRRSCLHLLPALPACRIGAAREGETALNQGLPRKGCSPSGREQGNGKGLASGSPGIRWERAAFPREAEDGAKSPAWPQGTCGPGSLVGQEMTGTWGQLPSPPGARAHELARVTVPQGSSPLGLEVAGGTGGPLEGGRGLPAPASSPPLPSQTNNGQRRDAGFCFSLNFLFQKSTPKKQNISLQRLVSSLPPQHLSHPCGNML